MADAKSTTRRPWLEGSTLGAGVALAALLLVLVNYFGWKYHARFDWTKAKIYSLSEKSENVTRALTQDIDVVVFAGPGTPLLEEIQEILARYQAVSSRLKVRTIDPVKNPIDGGRLLEQYGARYAEGSIKVVFDDGKERRIFDDQALAEYDYSGMQMGQQPTVEALKAEEVFTGALVELSSGKKPKVRFVTGHGEHALADPGAGFRGLAELLARNNVETEDWRSLGQAAVPAETDLLVVAGPRTSFVPPELAAFSAYVASGGRMLWLLDPPLAGNNQLVDLGIKDWFAGLGVTLGSDLVFDTDRAVPFFGAETFFAETFDRHPVSKALADARLQVIFSLARSVRKGTEIAGYTVTEVIKTGEGGWGETDFSALPKVEKSATDVAGPLSVAVAIEAATAKEGSAGTAGARLVVVGDAEFASDSLIGSGGNAVLVDNAFNWLLKRESMLGIPPKKPEQVKLSLTGDQWLTVMVLIALLPLLAVGAGIAVFLRRRR